MDNKKINEITKNIDKEFKDMDCGSIAITMIEIQDKAIARIKEMKSQKESELESIEELLQKITP